MIFMGNKDDLAAGLFLLSEPEGKERETSNLDDLKTNTWKITNGTAGTTHTGNKNTVVIIDKTEGTIAWDESGDDLAVLLELDTDGLTNSGVWLLGFDSDLTDDNARGHGGTFKWSLVDSSVVTLAIAVKSPKVVLVGKTEFTTSKTAACL